MVRQRLLEGRSGAAYNYVIEIRIRCGLGLQHMFHDSLEDLGTIFQALRENAPLEVTARRWGARQGPTVRMHRNLMESILQIECTVHLHSALTDENVADARHWVTIAHCGGVERSEIDDATSLPNALGDAAGWT